jgi:hypothetical protein
VIRFRNEVVKASVTSDRGGHVCALRRNPRNPPHVGVPQMDKEMTDPDPFPTTLTGNLDSRPDLLLLP